MDRRDKLTREPSGHHPSDPIFLTHSHLLLSAPLSGTIDPAVNGGISNYQCFLDGSYRLAHPEIAEDVDSSPTKQQIIEQLRTSLYEQLQLLEEGMKLHHRKCLPEMRPLHEHLTHRHHEMSMNLRRLLEVDRE
jgi:hypothetical protein